jgi:hypothetical protein
LLALRGLHAKRGGQGRRGGYELEQRTAMLQALAHLQNLWLDMSTLEVYEATHTGTRRRTPTRQAIQSRAFTITDLFGQTRLDAIPFGTRFAFHEFAAMITVFQVPYTSLPRGLNRLAQARCRRNLICGNPTGLCV